VFEHVVVVVASSSFVALDTDARHTRRHNIIPKTQSLSSLCIKTIVLIDRLFFISLASSSSSSSAATATLTSRKRERERGREGEMGLLTQSVQNKSAIRRETFLSEMFRVFY
jgi:hypothetical protein